MSGERKRIGNLGQIAGRRPRRRERGVLLGIVLVLLIVMFAAGAFAVWGLRGDTGAAGRDREARQLFDCAEQGLAWGKQYFSSGPGRQWGNYLGANNCTLAPPLALPCPPFPQLPQYGQYPSYPGGAPFVKQVNVGPGGSGQPVAQLQYQVGIYDDPETDGNPAVDTNSQVIIYSKCTDLATGQTRAVSAMLNTSGGVSDDYIGQAGHGYRNQGNNNNQ